MQVIPLTNGPANAHQQFFIQLGENFLEMKLNYITRSVQWCDGAWSLDIYQDGVLLVGSAMLAPGADILTARNANLGRLKFVGDEPTIDNLGTANQLVWEES